MGNIHRRTGFFLAALLKSHSFFLLLLLVAGAAVQARPSFAADRNLVDKIIEAYGGREALERVAALRADGKITAFMPDDRGSYVYVLKRGGKLLVDIRYSKGSEKRILDGDRGYSGTDEEVTPASGAAYRAMVYQYDQLDLPYGLLDGALTPVSAKNGRLRGRAVDMLKLRDRSGNEIEIAVDRETHLIVKTSGAFMMGDQLAVLSSELSDFRKTGGIALPFTIVNYADGFRISETRIEKYTVNPEVSDSAFSP